MATESVPRILGQLRPANTTAAALYTPGANIAAEITSLVICNQSGSDSSFRIFLDVDGTTYDETTALFWDIAIVADMTWLQEVRWGLKTGGNLAVATGNNNALTFTAFGRE